MKRLRQRDRLRTPKKERPKYEWRPYITQEANLSANVIRFCEHWGLSNAGLKADLAKSPFVMERFDDIEERYRFAYEAVDQCINRTGANGQQVLAVAAYFAVSAFALLKRQYSFAEIERFRQRKLGGKFTYVIVGGPFDGRLSAWWTRPVERMHYRVWTVNDAGYSAHVYEHLNGRMIFRRSEHSLEQPRRASMRVVGHPHGEPLGAA